MIGMGWSAALSSNSAAIAPHAGAVILVPRPAFIEGTLLKNVPSRSDASPVPVRLHLRWRKRHLWASAAHNRALALKCPTSAKLRHQSCLMLSKGLRGADWHRIDLGRKESPMCDFSLQSVRSRPAKVGDKLVTRDFGTGTRGFSASDDPGMAVCVLPGTELALSLIHI